MRAIFSIQSCTKKERPNSHSNVRLTRRSSYHVYHRLSRPRYSRDYANRGSTCDCGSWITFMGHHERAFLRLPLDSTNGGGIHRTGRCIVPPPPGEPRQEYVVAAPEIHHPDLQYSRSYSPTKGINRTSVYVIYICTKFYLSFYYLHFISHSCFFSFRISRYYRGRVI